jgi:hypothetical protein
MTPSPHKRRQMSRLYAPKRTIKHWEVVQLGKVIYTGTAALCQSYIDKNRLVNAVKYPVYGK